MSTPALPQLRWLRRFVDGRWHAVVDGSRGHAITMCALPIADYERAQVRGDLPAGVVGCTACHQRLGCLRGHVLGQCPDVCPCPCAASLVVDIGCAACRFPGPLRGAYGAGGLLSRCPHCGAQAGPHEEPSL